MPPQAPTQTQMSVQDFAAWVKKQDPELAPIPDQYLVDKILERRPDLRRMIRVPEKPTFLQKTWPQDATISAYHPQTGLAGVREQIERARQQFSTRLFGVQPEGGAGEILGSIPLGESKAMMGDIDIARGLVGQGPGMWQGIKEAVGGRMQELELPASFMSPEAARAAAPINKEMNAEQAAKALADVVNPAAKQFSGYEKTLSQHLDKILEFAGRRKLKIDSLESLTRAIQGASKELQTYYYDKILKPVGNVKVSIAGKILGYSGSGEGTTATLSQLDARLAQINNDLAKYYGRGGKAAEVAVKSQEELVQEAAGIRSVLYPELGKVTGINPEEIGNLRQTFGSLREAADVTQQSSVAARRSASTAKYAPKTVSPFGKSGKSFAADRLVEGLAQRKREGDIKKIIPMIRTGEYKPPTPKFSKPGDILRTAPTRGESSPIGTLGTSTPEEISAHQQQLKDRVSQVLASRGQTVRKPVWEMGEDELEQLRRGGGRPGTVSPLEKMKMAQDQVNSLRLQVARDPGNYNTVSQLQKAEGDLETLQNSMMKGVHGPTGENFTPEEKAKFMERAKEKWGIK